MTKLVKRELVLLKIETTKGTDSVPTAASDAILAEDFSWSFAGARMAERNPVKGALGREQSIHAGTLMEVTFRTELKGSGTAGTAPEIGQALRACGMGETIVASTSVTYEPVSTAIESASIYFFEDGSQYRLVGCQGVVNFTLEVGEVGYAEFTFTGHIAGYSDVTLPSPTYDAVEPPPVLGAAMTALGFSADIAAFSLDLGNEVSTPASMKEADGYGDVIIVDRDIVGSFDPKAELVADKNWYNEWITGASGVITSGTVGATAGNIYQLSAPTAYYREVGPGDRDGLRTYEIGFGCAGDDAAVDLVFT